MTLVHFNYTDSYNKPSRGSLAFTPHRRHAANETEILPKPVTVPLLNGELTVDLQPNPSTWVWIITEYFDQHSESMYTTIPDSDGVVEAVDLVRINPSTIPAPYNAVEPVWWAEMRQYKQTVTDTLLQSEEALTEAKEAIEVGSESIERTQHNASLAKAYAAESREDSYKSREYRDEAEQWRDEAKEQADRAASGPESAAQRAEDAAESAQSNEVATRGYRDEARNSAAEAHSSETSANGSASTATERASDARNEANRAESEANRAKGYADELMEGPREYAEQAETARDQAQEFSVESSEQAQISVTAASESEAARDTAQQYRDETQQFRDELTSTRNTGLAYLSQSSQVIEPSDYETLVFETIQSQGDAVATTDTGATVQTPGWYAITTNIRHISGVDITSVQMRLNAGSHGMIVSAVNNSNALNASMAATPLAQGDEISVQLYHNSDTARELQEQTNRPNSLQIHFIAPLDS